MPPKAPPDRETWPGWVEMESEPAFFNVMLDEMGVQGLKVREVYDMDETFLLTLPQPVHALIFLFRYKEDSQQQASDDCPEGVWFANQTPDFACATFALLNIVNNIPDLLLGTELKNFRDFTQDMDPLSRGDAVDSFDFVKRMHNSFARDNDLLQADQHMKGKADKARKRQAIAKGKATKAAKKAALAAVTPLKQRSPNVAQPTRAGRVVRRPLSRKSPKESTPEGDEDGDYEASKTTKLIAMPDNGDGVRRSQREPKPRQSGVQTAELDPEDEDGFHFVAYMPINGNVWKLDGLDRFPQIVGPYSEDGAGWIYVAQPHLVGRMEQYAASEIQFNLMAVVHDPLINEKKDLMVNIKTLQVIEQRLDTVCEDWRAMEGGDRKKDVILVDSLKFGITARDVGVVELGADAVAGVQEAELLALLELRQEAVRQQSGLRAAVRDSLELTREDEEKTRHRRHDYGSFVRGWLGVLAEEEMLNRLME
ncbi:hypothetical protein LTR53_000954 [Teratosphaeriaceae sp. CCFEE 6253]|nr:hypothetical protein LTR53_000954 [Teratosphaeriaceae sp. CCFEE 6253]